MDVAAQANLIIMNPPRYRWTICALLFFATTLNYADRQILGILAPVLQREIGWSEAQYGWIVTAFQAAYAIGLLGVGRLIDLIGVRRGYLLSVTWWSIAAAGHGFASSAGGFGVARFLLGFGESGNFPAAIRTITEWFNQRERAFATGLFNSGSNVGAIAAPLLVPWLTIHYGWRWAFVATGAAGALWVVAWLALYRSPAKATPPASTVPWRSLIADNRTWGLVAARFLTDPVWWFYLYWTPKFLNTKFGLDLLHIGLPLIVIYLTADGGSIFGGWLSSYMVRRGWRPFRARKAAMLVSALMVVPIAYAPHTSHAWVAIALLSLATAGHCSWAANVFTILSDLYPKQAVGSMVGICGFGASVGGMIAAGATGLLLQFTGSYAAVFAMAGIAYLAGLAIIQTTVHQREIPPEA